MRSRAIMIVFVLVLLAGVAHGQDPTDPASPLTLGRGPKDGELVPAWIFYWLLGIGSAVVIGLLGGLRILWGSLNEERKAKDKPGLTEDERAWVRAMHDVVSKTDGDGVHRVYVPTDLRKTLTELVSFARESMEKLEQIHQSKEDRAALRTAFEQERSEMRSIYTEEIKQLQAKLSQEQRERRDDTQQLWRQNNDTTREVMTVIKDMIVALENSSRVIETWAPELGLGNNE